jgi:hypothetical protein
MFSEPTCIYMLSESPCGHKASLTGPWNSKQPEIGGAGKLLGSKWKKSDKIQAEAL